LRPYGSVNESLDLQFAATNSGCFVPVYLSASDGSIGEPNLGEALPLSPPPTTIELSKAGNFSNSGPCRKGLDMRDVANYREVHRLDAQIATTVLGCHLTLLFSGRLPLRTGERAILCEHGAATMHHGPLQLVVRLQRRCSRPGSMAAERGCHPHACRKDEAR
jgi:hypothetical protein